MTFYGGQAINVRSYQGRLDEFIDPIERSIAKRPKLAAWRGALALGYARSGGVDQARGLIAENHAAGFPMPEDYTWSMSMGWWVQVAMLVREPAAAAALRELLVPYHDHMISFQSGFQACVAHQLGLVDHLTGRYEDAEQWFAQATRLHQRMRSPILIVETQAAWARLLADRNRGDDHDRARVIAQAAFDAASVGGWGYIEADASAVLELL